MPLQGVTILIVEDNLDSREITRRMLGQLGATVLLAENGKVGLEHLEKHRPDLILADLKMPVMDGYEFARLVKGNPDYRDVRLVALTGVPFEQGYLRTWALGFDGHIEKPVTFEKMDGLARYLSGGPPHA